MSSKLTALFLSFDYHLISPLAAKRETALTSTYKDPSWSNIAMIRSEVHRFGSADHYICQSTKSGTQHCKRQNTFVYRNFKNLPKIESDLKYRSIEHRLVKLENNFNGE